LRVTAHVMSKLHQSIMNLWPSKKQWNDWKLPSKLTAIGALVGVVALILAVLLFVLNLIFTPNVEKIVRRVADECKAELIKKYPTAYTVFGVSQDGFIVPKGLVPPNSDIKWNTAKIIELSEHTIKVFVPHMTINTETNKGLRINGQEVVLPKKVGAKCSMISLPALRIQVEIIGIYEQMVIAVIGFAPK
jgi:hypothetical protein